MQILQIGQCVRETWASGGGKVFFFRNRHKKSIFEKDAFFM